MQLIKLLQGDGETSFNKGAMYAADGYTADSVVDVSNVPSVKKALELYTLAADTEDKLNQQLLSAQKRLPYLWNTLIMGSDGMQTKINTLTADRDSHIAGSLRWNIAELQLKELRPQLASLLSEYDTLNGNAKTTGSILQIQAAYDKAKTETQRLKADYDDTVQKAIDSNTPQSVKNARNLTNVSIANQLAQTAASIKNKRILLYAGIAIALAGGAVLTVHLLKSKSA